MGRGWNWGRGYWAEVMVEPRETKRALIAAAGELFAEHGYEGTSIRAIAERVNANTASINYHFGSKEKLYTEVLRYVMVEVGDHGPSKYAGEDKWFVDDGAKAELIRHLVRDHFDAYFAPGQPRWHGRLVIRSMLGPTASLETVVRRDMLPDHQTLKTLLKRCSPGMSDAEARFCVFSLIGQIAFYVFGETPILMVLEREEYDQAFLAAAAEHVARATIAALGLKPGEGD